MSIDYKTVQGTATAEYEISKSRFIAFVQQVSSESEAIEYIQSIKKQHWEARHNCSAYIIGEHGTCQKADDDGEPSGTAGKPILEILKKNAIKDVVIVVTRYFGGIKLGAGGLIRAYGKVSTLGINAAQIVEKILYRRFHIRIDYALLGTLESNLRLQTYRIEKKEFSDQVQLTILVRKGDESAAKTAINNWTAAQCTLTESDEIYLELPLSEP